MTTILQPLDTVLFEGNERTVTSFFRSVILDTPTDLNTYLEGVTSPKLRAAKRISFAILAKARAIAGASPTAVRHTFYFSSIAEATHVELDSGAITPTSQCTFVSKPDVSAERLKDAFDEVEFDSIHQSNEPIDYIEWHERKTGN